MAHKTVSQVWKLIPIILVLGRLKQNNDRFEARGQTGLHREFQANLKYTLKTLFKKKKKRFVCVLLFLCSV